MRISLRWLTVCAAICALPLAVRGIDTEAQAKAREALDIKLKELQSQSPPEPAPAPAPPAPAPRARKKAVAPPMQPPQPAVPIAAAPQPAPQQVAPPVAQPVPTFVPANSDAIAKAREAVRQQLSTLPEPPPEALAAAPSPNSAALPTPTPAANPGIVSQPAFGPVAEPAADAQAIAKAREALRQQLAQLPPEPAATPEQPTTGRPPGVKAASLNFPSLEAPPVPFSAAKQERLRELLRRYQTDQITPEQYQAERAKIIGEP